MLKGNRGNLALFALQVSTAVYVDPNSSNWKHGLAIICALTLAFWAGRFLDK